MVLSRSGSSAISPFFAIVCICLLPSLCLHSLFWQKAADYGYRDGSGIHRVIQCLEKKAKDDQVLARRLKALAKHVSRVKS